MLARLLPDAYRDDPEAAGEFRRYTEQGLRSGKVAAAQTVLATLPAGGGRVRLSARGRAGVAAARSTTSGSPSGCVLGITEDYEDESARHQPGGPACRPTCEVYHWLAYLQETLVARAVR